MEAKTTGTIAAEESPVPPSEDVKPPYAPFLTFKNFIEKLHTSGVPHRIDKSVMSNLSGAAQSQILLAMRFLRLTAVNGDPAPRLHELVDSFGTSGWATTLHDCLRSSYGSIVEGLELSKATPAQLSEAFKSRGKTDGSVTEKAIRFYLKGLEDAGVKYSTHLGRNASGRRREENESPRSKMAAANRLQFTQRLRRHPTG